MRGRSAYLLLFVFSRGEQRGGVDALRGFFVVPLQCEQRDCVDAWVVGLHASWAAQLRGCSVGFVLGGNPYFLSPILFGYG